MPRNSWRYAIKNNGGGGEMKKTRNSETLKSFVDYCKSHPQERFWQALRNWAEVAFVCVSDGKSTEDTFYREKK